MGALTSNYQVRRARAADVDAIAYVHVEAWRETYRGQMSDDVLDDPAFIPRRRRMWDAILTDPQYADRTTAVAEVDGQIVGIALTGPPREDGAAWERQLYLLYLLRAHHGSGAAEDLVGAVLDSATSACLWVADPNPRAQAFYAKTGFTPDGTTTVEDGVREIRMTRPCRPAATGATAY